MMQIETFPRLKIVGEVFGARGCGSSCACDPCDCNPCTCGSGHHGELQYPLWRVSGYHVTAGDFQGLAISGLTILSLAQPLKEGDNEHWQEILLVDSRATHKQAMGLLAQFEDQLEGMPAEVKDHPRTQRAVYQVPLEYFSENDELSLHVRFVTVATMPIRQGADQTTPRDWSYVGPMVLREKVSLTQPDAISMAL